MHKVDVLIAWMWRADSIVCFIDRKQRFISTRCLQPASIEVQLV